MKKIIIFFIISFSFIFFNISNIAARSMTTEEAYEFNKALNGYLDAKKSAEESKLFIEKYEHEKMVEGIYYIIFFIIVGGVFVVSVTSVFKTRNTKTDNIKKKAKDALLEATAKGFNIHKAKKQCGYCLKYIMLKSVVCPYCNHTFTRHEIEIDVIHATQRFMNM